MKVLWNIRTRSSVYAQSQNVFYSLAELLNIKKDISPYHSVIGSSFTKDGVTTTLNDVIWDDDVLLISYTLIFLLKKTILYNWLICM